MAKRIGVSNLNATTVDILNTIRANASYEYQSLVPEITEPVEIPKVGEVLYGYPALANQFLNALVNRIAHVRVKSAVFNNAYAELKKGFLEFGETVEEVYVNIAKAREFSAEKGEARELKRSLPDVRTAFHVMNWRVQYPVTIQDVDLRTAFTSIDGVTDLIAKIVNSVYTAAEYDEYLLFKYLIIKGVTSNKMYRVPVQSGVPAKVAIAFRGMSNKLTFMSKKYNASGVTTVTPKSDQYIFMSSDYNADFDVSVLASAFNMDKADFMGKLKLVDDWHTFDNERFSEIVAESGAIELVTDEELQFMQNVKAVLVDSEWFQVYDNQSKFTEKYVASGMYWNYFYNVWKTVSTSPFSNAVVFIENMAVDEYPETLNFFIDTIGEVDHNTIKVFRYSPHSGNSTLPDYEFIQNEVCTKCGIAVQRYGAIMYNTNTVFENNNGSLESVPIDLKVGGVLYRNTGALTNSSINGQPAVFEKVVE